MTKQVSLDPNSEQYLQAYPPRDYLIEKQNNVVAYLARHCDELNKHLSTLRTQGSQTIDVYGYISGTLFDATKLLAAFSNSEWDVNDAHTIVMKGYAGYEEIAVKYKLINSRYAAKETGCNRRRASKAD